MGGEAQHMAHILPPGTVIENRYRVVQLIGKGGMGAVYEAVDQRFESTVALKQMFLDPSLSPNQADQVIRAFKREAKTLNHLQHPALPHVSDYFLDSNGHFLVMKYIQGSDLNEWLTQRMRSTGKPFTEQEILPWMFQVLDALEYLHEQTPQVIHRDIKPHNIKVTQRGQVYLLDFGISKGVSTATAVSTGKSSIYAYTLGYAPLEQIQGTGTDPRSDLFSLAATMYHLLTGRSLDEDPRCDAQTRSLAFIKQRPDPLTPPPGVSPQVSDVMMQALALDSEHRPASARAMREALEGKRAPATSETIPVGSPPPPPTPPTSSVPQHVTPLPPPASIPTQPVSKSPDTKRPLPFAMMGIVVGVLVLLLGGGWFISNSMGGEEPQPAIGVEEPTDTPPPPTDTPPPPTNTPPPPTDTPTLIPMTNPLFPVTLDEWRNQSSRLSQDFTREGEHYWRYVPGGTYTIGGWTDDDDDDNDAQADVALPDYWIGKYPVTNQQYRQFIEAGGYTNERYWTPNGWEWKEDKGRTQPYWWEDTDYNSDNQPVVGVTWYEATAYANWLNEQLGETLPDGYQVQLPTEAAWDVACAYDANGQRHTYPWGDEAPTRDLADFDDGSDPDRAAVVGERPEGAAACGAQDMVGTVWEAMSNSYAGYAAKSGDGVADFSPGDGDVPYRGGSWWHKLDIIRCAVRDRYAPDYYVNYVRGFRVVLLP
jgi:serine/threonine protein kinase